MKETAIELEANMLVVEKLKTRSNHGDKDKTEYKQGTNPSTYHSQSQEAKLE